MVSPVPESSCSPAIASTADGVSVLASAASPSSVPFGMDALRASGSRR